MDLQMSGRKVVTRFVVFILVWTEVYTQTHSEIKDVGLQEYCPFEVFNATCAGDEIIMMRTAEYGRMRLARCLQRDYGYVGCKENILPYIDSKCSGRHTCSFIQPDHVLDKLQPCPGDLKGYMEAAYSCQKVETGNGHLCGRPVRLTGPSGYISSIITQELQIGLSACPWLIEAGRGQRVVITLYDFALWREVDSASVATSHSMSHRPPETSGICHIYAQIRERTAATPVTLCGGEKRKKVVYTSEAESVKVELTNNRNAKKQSHFLLYYEVIGCPDIPHAENVHLERLGSAATLTCKSTGESWDMTCIDNVWTGKTRNCSHVKAWGLTDFIENAISLPQGVLIVIILGIALVIAVIILTVGLWTLKRRQHQPMVSKDGCLATSGTAGGQNYIRRGPQEVGANKEHYPMLANPERGPHERRPESEYTSTWQRRSQVPATRIFPDGTLRRVEYDRGDTLSRAMATGHCPPYTLQQREGLLSASPIYPPLNHHPEHHVEHIYESPKFDRKLGRRYDEFREGPFYHELDPDSLSTCSSQPDVLLNPELVGRTAHLGLGRPGRRMDTNCALEESICPVGDFPPPPPPDLPPPNPADKIIV